MGICSTWWPNNSPIAICPKRLLQGKTIFINVANYVFGGIDDVLLFSEVKLKRIGTFDFVLVKHKPISNEIDDFCVVEFQTDSTTGTGKLVKAIKDYTKGEDEIAEKSLFKHCPLIPAMPDLLKIHDFQFSIALSGHVSLVFQGSFITF